MARYGADEASLAVIGVLRGVVRKLLASSTLRDDQLVGLAKCLVVLVEFPQVLDDYELNVSISFPPEDLPGGTLKLSLEINAIPGELGASIGGCLVSPTHGSDSLTACEWEAIAGEDSSYENYQFRHGIPLPALDNALVDMIDIDGAKFVLTVEDHSAATDRGEDDGKSPASGQPPHADPDSWQWNDAGTEVHNINCTDDDLLWLAEHDERAARIRSLDISGSGVTDAGLAALQRMPVLRTLFLEATAITDATSKILGGLNFLQELRVGYNAVGDEILSAIAAMSDLRTLTLCRTSISPSGLQRFIGLSQLQFLDVSENPLGNATSSLAPHLVRLTRFAAEETQLTDQGLWSWEEHPTLEVIQLKGNHLTDHAPFRLATMPSPAIIDLSHNAITDGGLGAFLGSRSLRQLTLYGTYVTAEGVEELQRSLPQPISIGFGLRDQDDHSARSDEVDMPF